MEALREFGLGLAVALRWDRAAALLAVTGSDAFVASIRDIGVLWIALVDLAPVACFSVNWITKSRSLTGGC